LRLRSVLGLRDADGGHLEIILALSECSCLVPNAGDIEILKSKGILDHSLFGV
jgi:hypothetical protein